MAAYGHSHARACGTLQPYDIRPVMCIKMLVGRTRHASHRPVADDGTSAAKPSYNIAQYRGPLSTCSLALTTLYALFYSIIRVGYMLSAF